LTHESRKYFALSKEDQEFYAKSRFSVVKTDTANGVMRLQVLVESDGRQTALFRYPTLEDGRYLLQYPFLILGRDWPVFEGTWVTLHSSLLSGNSGDPWSEDSLNEVLRKLDSFCDLLDSLVGLAKTQHVDYYLCEDLKEAARLAGRKDASSLTQPGCAVSTLRLSFDGLASAILVDRKSRIDLMRLGILGYAERRGARERGVPERVMHHRIVGYMTELGSNPIESLLVDYETQDDRKRQGAMVGVGGVLVELLLSRGDAVTFSQLYNSATTSCSFAKELSTLYGISVTSIDSELVETYEVEKGGRGNQGP
jgi:hypothetical protein